MTDTNATTHPWRTMRRIGEGPGGVVLTVDFDTGRGEAGFAALGANLKDYSVLVAVPPTETAALPPAHDHEGYVRPWLSEIIERGEPVAGVLGRCAGSSLARTLAAGLREAGFAEVPLLVFDPVRVDGLAIAREYELAVASLADRLEPDELRHARQALESRAGGSVSADGTLSAGATALSDAYARALDAACRALPVAPDLKRQLKDRFATYMRYLVAAADAERPRPPRASDNRPIPAVVLSTADTADTADTIDTTVDPRSPVARFAVDRLRILADPDVAGFVAKALARGGPQFGGPPAGTPSPHAPQAPRSGGERPPGDLR